MAPHLSWGGRGIFFFPLCCCGMSKIHYLIQPLIKERMICSLTQPNLVASVALEGSVSFNSQMIKLLLSRKVIGRMENGKNMGAHTIGNLQSDSVCQSFCWCPQLLPLSFSRMICKLSNKGNLSFRQWGWGKRRTDEPADLNSHATAPSSEDRDTSLCSWLTEWKVDI